MAEADAGQKGAPGPQPASEGASWVAAASELLCLFHRALLSVQTKAGFGVWEMEPRRRDG